MATSSNLYKEVNLSSIQILNLGGTVELLPNAGTGVYYDIDKIILEYTEGTISYTFSNYISLFYGGNRMLNISQELINNGENAAVCITPSIPTEDAGGLAYIKPFFFQGTGLLLGTADSSSPTNGDGTMKVKIWYNIRKFG